MTMQLLGEIDVELEKDEQTGHRDYMVRWLVVTDNKWIGPYSVMNCPGLPTPGSPWSFGPYGDQNLEIDPYAFCQGYAKVTPRVTSAPNTWWEVQQKFSTRPFERPHTIEYGHPASEFPKVKGGFTKRTQEDHRAQRVQVIQNGVAADLFSNLIRNTAWERFTGKNVEFDKSMPFYSIQMYWSSLYDGLINLYIDCLNDRTLWGFPPRCVKLADYSFERLVYQLDTWIYLINLEFEVSIRRLVDVQGNVTFVSGHDRQIPNVGEKVRIPNGDPNNPLHYDTYRGPISREKSKLYLDTLGDIWVPQDPLEEPPYIYVSHDPEVNFFDLGVPSEI